jgi:peptidoglycan/xylan/chitin deacetylase (PgdA/CDA1 family)
MLDWRQIEEMHRAGISFGAHTKSHPILSRLGDRDLEEEIAGSKRTIENHLNAPVVTFAYPNGRKGDYDERAKNILAKVGFSCAVTSCRGLNYRYFDPFELSRSASWDTDPQRFYARLVFEQLLDKPKTDKKVNSHA